MSTRRSCAYCAVRADALCGALHREQLSRVSRIAYQRRYNAGQFIVGAGQQQDWFATVLSGVVKLAKTTADGRHQIVGLLFPSDLLGRPFGSGSPFTAEAATAVELCCLDRRYFEELLLKSVEMKQLFLEQTLNEVDAAREWMLLLGRKTAEERVASLLLLMAQRMHAREAVVPAGGQGMCYELPLSRTEMAEYLGLRIETVSRQIKRLRTAGVIQSLDGRAIVVNDIVKLAHIAGREGG